MFSPMGMSIGAAMNYNNCCLLEAVPAILDLENLELYSMATHNHRTRQKAHAFRYNYACSVLLHINFQFHLFLIPVLMVSV